MLRAPRDHKALAVLSRPVQRRDAGSLLSVALGMEDLQVVGTVRIGLDTEPAHRDSMVQLNRIVSRDVLIAPRARAALLVDAGSDCRRRRTTTSRSIPVPRTRSQLLDREFAVPFAVPFATPFALPFAVLGIGAAFALPFALPFVFPFAVLGIGAARSRRRSFSRSRYSGSARRSRRRSRCRSRYSGSARRSRSRSRCRSFSVRGTRDRRGAVRVAVRGTRDRRGVRGPVRVAVRGVPQRLLAC